MSVRAVTIGAVLTAGNDWAQPFTLTGSGDITSATVTCSIRPAGEAEEVLSDKTVAITTPNPSNSNALVTLTLTDTETALFRTPAILDPEATVTHYGDIKVVKNDAGTTVETYGPFAVAVKRAQT